MEPAEEPPSPNRPKPVADERLANAYAEGYGEGIRDALREVLQAVRYSTPQEIRWQVQSRLARVREDVDVKRRAMLAPPTRAGWPLDRRVGPTPGGPPAPPPAPAGGPTITGTLQGGGALFVEGRPTAAPAHAGRVWRPYGRVLAFGRSPDPPLPVPESAVTVLAVGRSGWSSAETAEPDLATQGGRLRTLLQEGTALVYCDCVDYLAREFGEESTLRFLDIVVDLVRDGSGWLVVSVGPDALSPRTLAALRRRIPSGS